MAQWITTSEDFFKKNMYLSFYCNVCVWERVGDRTKTAIYWPHSYGHQRCVFLVLLMLNWRAGAHSAGFLYCTLSPTGLVPKLHLVSITSDLQLSDFLSWPSYIIVQRPLNRPLNLWNGMFDRHQAEITVMQFRGHSLPVHQSMRVSWAFTTSHFISQIHPRDLFRLLAIGMCHFLPVHHFGMACLPGPKVSI